MAGNSFIASEEVGALDYDFGSGVVGPIPEPTVAQIDAFRKAYAKVVGPELVKQAERLAAANDPAEALRVLSSALAEADDAQATKRGKKDEAVLIDAVGAVCSDSPSAEVIRLQPYRVQQAFIGWIVGTFLIPKA